jgi:hypothetical protein
MYKKQWINAEKGCTSPKELIKSETGHTKKKNNQYGCSIFGIFLPDSQLQLILARLD